MKGLEELREAAAEFLNEKGVTAVTAWSGEARRRHSGPVTAVTLRSCEGGPAGFRDYLGERYNLERDVWEELYGKRATLTLGLDIYAPKSWGEGGCAAHFARLAEVLADDGPEGLTVQQLRCGETVYDQAEGLFRCKAEAVCEVYLYAVAEDGGAFADFRVKGRNP